MDCPDIEDALDDLDTATIMSVFNDCKTDAFFDDLDLSSANNDTIEIKYSWASETEASFEGEEIPVLDLIDLINWGSAEVLTTRAQ
jgi:hypothetical protein